VVSTFTSVNNKNKDVKNAVSGIKKEMPISNKTSLLKNNTVLEVNHSNKKLPIEDVVTVQTINERKGNLKEKRNMSYTASYHEVVQTTPQSIPYNQLPIKDSQALVTRQLPNKTHTITTVNTDNKIVANNQLTNSTPPTTSLAQSTIYKELDETNDDGNITIGNINISREKLKGIMHKATQLFERKHKVAIDTTKR
jgi:hypothetical protein